MPNVVVKTYDPKSISVSFGGVTISGYADGTFVRVTRSGNLFDKKKGAAGDVERVNKNAFDFSVEITLQQTAAANQALSVVANADSVANLGVAPLVIKDLLGNTLFMAPQAWIAKDPDLEYGDDTAGRVWLFETGNAGLNLGGN